MTSALHAEVGMRCPSVMAELSVWLGQETASVLLKERTKHLEVEEGKYQCKGVPTIFGAGDVSRKPIRLAASGLSVLTSTLC